MAIEGPHPKCRQTLALGKLVVPFGGLLRGRLRPGEVVIINGATGYFGSAALLLALAMGAARVVAAGRNRHALSELAAQLGPRAVPVALEGVGEDDVEALREASGGADLALDLLGQASSTATTLACLRALRRGGRLVLMGSAAEPLSVTFAEMLANDWEVIGNFMYPKDAPGQIIRLAAAGLLDLAAVRTKRFALSDLRQAVDAAAHMRGLEMTMVTP
jgi:alcohol dehydrogenase